MQLNRIVTIAAAGLLLCGCSMQSGNHGEEFDDNYSSRAVWHSMDKQAALGAADEATLRAGDFNGADLNGLGMAHLDAMMQEKPGPAVVYVNLDAKDSMTAARRDAASKYLATLVTEGQHAPRVEVGANLAMRTPARDGNSHLSKTENPPLGSSESSGSTTTGTPSMSSGGMK